MSDVSEAEIDAALQELLHERNSLGDGCFGCGSGDHWGEKQIHGRIPYYREMLKRILEAAKGVKAPAPALSQPVYTGGSAMPRRKPSVGGPGHTDDE